MRIRAFGLFPLCALLVVESHADAWTFSYKPTETAYVIYGGHLGDPAKPGQKDAKVAFHVTGSAAKELFEAIGPDKANQCSPVAGVRYRSKDAQRLECLREADGQYACYFGFDLRTGKSIGGSVC